MNFCKEDVLQGRDEISYFIYDLIPIENFDSWVSQKEYRLLQRIMSNLHDCDEWSKNMLCEKLLDYIKKEKELQKLQKSGKYYGILFFNEGKNIVMNYNSDMSTGDSNYIVIPYPFDIYYKSKIRNDSKKLPHITCKSVDFVP